MWILSQGFKILVQMTSNTLEVVYYLCDPSWSTGYFLQVSLCCLLMIIEFSFKHNLSTTEAVTLFSRRQACNI